MRIPKNQLEEMRGMVGEKLQTTLDDKISRSFATVSEQLNKVYSGLGEMQSLAAGVGDLKKSSVQRKEQRYTRRDAARSDSCGYSRSRTV